MIYFKYKVSFKKAKDLDNLLKNQNIDRILEEAEFKERQLNGDNIYCFIDPYCQEINGETVLNWEETEQQAIDTFHRSAEDV